MIVITQQLARKLPAKHPLLTNKTINPLEITAHIKDLADKPKLIIYDVTKIPNKPAGSVFGVKNHINRTGTNPLIGQQKTSRQTFLDISTLYNYRKHFITTHCCGQKLNMKFSFPSHHLCYISIYAKFIRIPEISAFLINFP